MKTLFSDLDGTFIPEDDDSLVALNDFKYYLKSKMSIHIVYVTGRSLSETESVIDYANLPSPEYLICDVGTTIYKKDFSGYTILKDYYSKQQSIIEEFSREELVNELIKIKGIELQEKDKQRPFKISFYFNYQKLKEYDFDSVIKGKPWNKIISVDKNGTGLLDYLPMGINKYSAIEFFIDRYKLNKKDCVFAGDSGNDLQVFNSDINSIVVNNCTKSVKDAVSSRKNIYISKSNYTAGVLEGCKYFGIL